MHIIDCNNYVRRMVEADPTGRALSTVFSTIQALPGVPICVWDGPNGNARRRKFYPDYKGGRKMPDPTIFTAMDNCRALLSLSKAIVIRAEGWEADDVIATLALRHFSYEQIRVHTTDMDMLQLPNVKIDRDKTPAPPEFLRLYKTLVGDKSDNIPGIKLFGDKSWEALSDSHKGVLNELFLTKQHINWDTVPMSKAARKWIDLPENEQLVRSFWKITGFFDVPDAEMTFEPGTNDTAAAWEILRTYDC